MFDKLMAAGEAEQMRFIAAVMKASEADKLLEAGEHAAGVAAYREAIAICPDCPTRGDYHVLLGYHYFSTGEAAAAERDLLSAFDGEGCSHPYEAHRRLGLARAAQGRFAEALDDLRRANEMGEDVAFANQAAAIFALAQGDLAAAAEYAKDGPELDDSDSEPRRRHALVRAEIAQLSGDTDGFDAARNKVAELAQADGMNSELALWLAVLDRVAGLAAPREVVRSAFAGQPDWAARAWPALLDQEPASVLMSALEPLSWAERAENLCQFRRLAGLLAEHAGDAAAARKHYLAARSEAFTQWCIDYHLAGIGLARLGMA